MKKKTRAPCLHGVWWELGLLLYPGFMPYLLRPKFQCLVAGSHLYFAQLIKACAPTRRNEWMKADHFYWDW